MAFNLRSAVGYTGTDVSFASADEYAYISGNTLTLRKASDTLQQTIINGPGLGLGAIATNARCGLVAIADKGVHPVVHVYEAESLREVVTLQPHYSLGVSAMTFSADGSRLAVTGVQPDVKVTVYDWKSGSELVSAPFPTGSPSPASCSFHPYDPDRLLTTGGGVSFLWRIHRTWDKRVMKPHMLQCGSDAHSEHTCHAWYQDGAYIATSNGDVFFLALDQMPSSSGTDKASVAQPDRQALPSVRGDAGELLRKAAEIAGVDRDQRDVSNSTEQHHQHHHAHLSPTVKPEDAAGAVSPHQHQTLHVTMQVVDSPRDQITMSPCIQGLPGPITCMALNRDLLMVAGKGHVSMYVHGRFATPTSTTTSVLVQAHTQDVGPHATVTTMAIGGPSSDLLVVGCSDGRLLQITGLQLPPLPQPQLADYSLDEQQQQGSNLYPEHNLYGAHQQQQQGGQDHASASDTAASGTRSLTDVQVSVVVDSHAGQVTGIAPYPAQDAVSTIGVDGSLRLVQPSTGSLLVKRKFEGCLTAIAVAPNGIPLAAVGSEAGVLRLVALPSSPAALQQAGSQPAETALHVTWRRRVHRGAVSSAAFSNDATMLVTAGKDNCVWFSALDVRSGTATVLGQVSCPEAVLGLCWPEVHSAEDCVMVSLASGAILVATTPKELAATCRPSSNADMQLTAKDVSVKVLRLETPIVSMAHIPGEKYGEILGLGADAYIHRIVLPADGQAWAGLKGRMHKSAARIALHARAGGAVAVSANHQLVVTGSEDGTIATHTANLMTICTLQGPANSHNDAVSRSASYIGMGGAVAQPPTIPGVHDVTEQGVCAVSFDHSGRYILSAGKDGSLFIYNTPSQGHHITRIGSMSTVANPAAANNPMSAAASSHGASRWQQDGATDADAADDPEEVTEAVALKQRLAAAAAAAATSQAHHTHQAHASSQQITVRLDQLRAAVAECVKMNDKAPDLEKVERQDFLIHHSLHASLMAQGTAHVARVRQEANTNNAALEVVSERICQSCWEDMAVKGGSVVGIKNQGLSVNNFPLTQDMKQRQVLSKVVFLRRMELLEQRQAMIAALQSSQPLPGGGGGTASNSGTTATDGTAVGSAAGSTGQPDAAQAPTPSSSSTSGTASGTAAAAVSDGCIPTTRMQRVGSTYLDIETAQDLMDTWSGQKSVTDVSQLLFSDQEVFTLSRKATQQVLVNKRIIEVKEEFNAEFTRIAKQKKTDADKIVDLNGKLEDILKELSRLDVPVPDIEDLRFTVHFPEDMDNVFEVTDDEVRRAMAAAAAAAAAQKRQQAAAAHGAEGSTDGEPCGDSGEQEQQEGSGHVVSESEAAERALRQMMGGTLAATEEHSKEFVLARPEWMDGNPKFFTEEQKKEFKEFQIKEKIIAEEKAKRVAFLELEMRTVRTAIDDAAANFDNQLLALSGRRSAALAQLHALELRLIELAAASDTVSAADEEVVRGVLIKMSGAQDQRAKIASEISEKRSVLQQLESQLSELVQEDKALDKNFRKEFGNAPESVYPELLRLYRLRLKQHPATAGGVGAQGGPTAAGGHHGKDAKDDASNKDRSPRHYALSHQGSKGGRSMTGPPSMSMRGPGSSPPSVIEHRSPSMIAAATTSVGVRPSSTLQAILKHPELLELQETTTDPWPQLPLAAAAQLPNNSSFAPGDMPPWQEPEPLVLGSEHCPEGLTPTSDIWEQLNTARSKKLQTEAEIRRIIACCSVLQEELPQLEATAAALQASADAAMEQVQVLRARRKAALHDCVIQLPLKAGQVEVVAQPGQLVPSDAEQSQLIHRSKVEQLNGVVRAKGEKKVEVLKAIKDFCSGEHLLQWEAAKCEIQIQELKHTVRDLQLLHVTRDMQAAYQAGGGGDQVRVADKQATAAETASLEALAKQRDALHKKTLGEKARTLRGVAEQLAGQSAHNNDVARHLVQLQKVLEEQQRLRGGMMDSVQAADKKMRRMVTQKKLKEIAQAQAAEITALAAEMDKLRLRTYPTFIETTVSPYAADTRLPPKLTASGSPHGLLPMSKSQDYTMGLPSIGILGSPTTRSPRK